MYYGQTGRAVSTRISEHTEEQFILLILLQRLCNAYINTTTAWVLKTLRSLTERKIITNKYFWKHGIPKETPIQGMTT